LARKDIWVTGFASSPIFLHKLVENQSLFHTLRYLPEKLRTHIGKQIDTAVPNKTGAIYRAILLGDRSHVDEDTLEIFKGSGTMHILAISGMHMAIIGALVYAGIFWLLSRSEQLLLHFTLKKWAAFLSLPVLLGYGLLAGMNTPVFRAVIMSSIVILSICTNRQKSPSALLAFAAILILTIDPLQLFTVSFQLSFSAIIGILFLLPVLKNLLDQSAKEPTPRLFLQKIINWIIAGLLVSLVANLATAPIALYSFNRFSTVGLIANLILEPLICLWSLSAGFISIPLFFILPEIGSFFLQIGAQGLDVAMHAAAFLSSFSFSTIWLPTPPVWLICIYFVVLIFLAFAGWKKRWSLLLSLSSLAGCIMMFLYPPSQYQRGDVNPFQISYLDVGQGSATFLEYPSGYRVLIDGGGSSFSTTTIGERIIAPFLWKKGIKNIDAIAITHPDADHYNGLEFVIKRFSPKTLWVRDKDGHDDNFKRLILLADKQRISVSIPDEGILWGERDASLESVANTSGWKDSAGSTESRASGNSGLVLKTCVQQLCALFPGDIGRSREQALVTQGLDLNADVLLAAHHGSITSNSSQFLAAVSPKYLLVSAGRSSKGYFPHKSLRKECETQQVDLFTTADQGTLKITTNQGGYKIYGYRRKDDNPLSSYHPVLLNEVSHHTSVKSDGAFFKNLRNLAFSTALE
jgi:competence protein ComEC